MMGSQWTSKYAILRDLSFAQGRIVPVAIDNSIGVGQKPPNIRINEDTEEEFFQNCVGDGDMHTKPDLSLIKHMINMVHESSPGNEDDDNTEKVVEISKLNPLSEEFVPNVAEVSAKNKRVSDKAANEDMDIDKKVNYVHSDRRKKTPKKRKERNVALMSLLEREQSLGPDSLRNFSILTSVNQVLKDIPEANNNINELEIKLLKPNDFIIDKNISDSVEKVNEWLQKPVQPQVDKMKPINISPKYMFKKKNFAPLRLENTCMFKRKSDTGSIKSSDSVTVPRPSENVFVPSTHADEYYKKFVERHQVQEKAQEDVWKRAERLMKEIDAKKLNEINRNIAVSSNGIVDLNEDLGGEYNTTYGPSDLTLIFKGVDTAPIGQAVLLSQHRHDLPEKCKVCLAFAKYNRNQEKSITESTQESSKAICNIQG